MLPQRSMKLGRVHRQSVDVRAYTDGIRHHTTTPIAYKVGDQFVMDVVLRGNQTSEQFPDGIFHP